MHDDENQPHFKIALTDEAYFAYASLPSERLLKRMTNDIGLLACTPLLGRTYNPAYEAKRPPFPCRVLYCEHYGIYYGVNDDESLVTIFAIEDQRRNPRKRFSSFEYGLERLD